MGYTEMHDPFVGPLPDYSNHYVAIGYSGHGMPRTYAWYVPWVLLSCLSGPLIQTRHHTVLKLLPP